MHVRSRPVLVFERLLPGSRMSCRDAGRPSAALHSAVNAAGPSTKRWQLSADHHLSAAPPSSVMNFNSITSSASDSKLSENLTPSALAALSLITNSNLVGC